jgi:multidrug resistance efflux pump
MIILIGSTLLVLAGILVPTFLKARSRDAVINANPITIRTPITGTLQSLPKAVGLEVHQGQDLAVIRNTSTNRDQLEQLRTALLGARSRQADLRGQELAQRQLLAAIRVDAERQRALEIRRNRQDLLQTTADLRRAQAELAFARRETKRIEALSRAGVLAANVYDRARTSEQARRSEVAGLEAKLRSGRTDMEAAANNLVLRTNRSGSDPAVRL